ncbi:hypothetical protein NHJ6243_009808 [Beauveria neobassiana]
MLSRDQRNYHAWAYRRYVVSHLESSELDGQKFSMIDRGLNVGPEDQSLWYYHQYLIFNVAEQPANLAIVPEMVVDDRVKLISRQVDFIKDLLEDYHDVKWIFEMLLEYTLLTYKLRNEPLGVEQSKELVGWVASIKRLDPQRFNRWQELAKKLKIPD